MPTAISARRNWPRRHSKTRIGPERGKQGVGIRDTESIAKDDRAVRHASGVFPSLSRNRAEPKNGFRLSEPPNTTARMNS